jgi:hypothetical protein
MQIHEIPFIEKERASGQSKTTQNKIDIKGQTTGGRYYYIDTLGTSGEYLIYQDEKISLGVI